MDEKIDSCKALRIIDRVELELSEDITPEQRRELVLEAYSDPKLKARFDLYDEKEDKPDWSGLVRDETCLVCEENYLGRGRNCHLRICDNCLEVHVAIRDADIIRMEKELEIPLKVYGCFSRE